MVTPLDELVSQSAATAANLEQVYKDMKQLNAVLSELANGNIAAAKELEVRIAMGSMILANELPEVAAVPILTATLGNITDEFVSAVDVLLNIATDMKTMCDNAVAAAAPQVQQSAAQPPQQPPGPTTWSPPFSGMDTVSAVGTTVQSVDWSPTVPPPPPLTGATQPVVTANGQILQSLQDRLRRIGSTT